jgi:hypothetical protein
MKDDRFEPVDGPLPESGMGGASDSGAHGHHPASDPRAPGRADQYTGDAAIERRRPHGEPYEGPKRRQSDRR